MGNITGTTAFVHYYPEDHNLTCIRKLHSLMNKNSPSEHVKEKKNMLNKDQKHPTKKPNKRKKSLQSKITPQLTQKNQGQAQLFASSPLHSLWKINEGRSQVWFYRRMTFMKDTTLRKCPVLVAVVWKW